MDRLAPVRLFLAILVTSPAFATDEKIPLYRCVDARGAVSLQDSPCPPGAKQSTLWTQRAYPVPRPSSAGGGPAPAAAAPSEATNAAAEAGTSGAASIEPERTPPPALYRCTSPDGTVRDSEQYDPNPRCEPLALYYPEPRLLTPQQAGACRWIEDSCVRLSNEAACERWREKKRQAASAALHAFSDTVAYRKSELARATQVVDEHCR